MRREQQHKQHFHIEPSFSSISLKNANQAAQTSTSRASSVARSVSSTLTRSSTPSSLGHNAPNKTPLNIPHDQSSTSTGRVLRAPALQSISPPSNPPHTNNGTGNNGTSPVLSGGHAAISIGSSSPKSSASGSPKGNSAFTSFFGTWRSQGSGDI